MKSVKEEKIKHRRIQNMMFVSYNIILLILLIQFDVFQSNWKKKSLLTIIFFLEEMPIVLDIKWNEQCYNRQACITCLL